MSTPITMRTSAACVLVVVLAALAPAPSQGQPPFPGFPWWKFPDMPKMPEIKAPEIKMPEVKMPSMDMKPLENSVKSLYSMFSKAMGIKDDLLDKMGDMFSLDKMKDALAKFGFPSYMYHDVEDMSGKTLRDMAKFMKYKISDMKDKVTDTMKDMGNKLSNTMDKAKSGLSKLKSAVNYYTG